MQCPHCGSSHHRVIDTRDASDSIRRRRQCEECSQRFTTYEHVAANLLVIKSDGRREPFDRQKLLAGIPKVIRVKGKSDRKWELATNLEHDIRADIFHFDVENKLTIIEMKKEVSSVEDVFQKLTK